MNWSDLRDVELLLFREAELADNNDYQAWLGLWAPELLYCVPCNDDTITPASRIALIYDDRPKLEERIFRLGTRHAHSQRPRSRLTRVVSNIVLGEYDPATGGSVTARFVAAEVRRDRQTLWAGSTRHTLVRDGAGLKIREKFVYLVNNDAPMPNLTFVI